MSKSSPNDLLGTALINQNGWFRGGKRLIKDKNVAHGKGRVFLSFYMLVIGEDMIERIVKKFIFF